LDGLRPCRRSLRSLVDTHGYAVSFVDGLLPCRLPHFIGVRVSVAVSKK
jgi:hypothetical protein